ncbi:MAG: asparagine synthetase A [Candidatus Kariarchaeaceae archaeon]
MQRMAKIISIVEKEKAIRRIQTITLKTVHDFFFEEGFEQLMPILLSPITDPLGPDPNSSIAKTGEIEYQGQKLQLTQSMIFHKQIAIGMGIEKLFIISPNVRLEDAEKQETGVHAFEFSQVDFEIKGATMEEIFELMEKLLERIISRVKELAKEELGTLERDLSHFSTPFPKYTSHELKDKYGSDWEKQASEEAMKPFFVTCHKREFYDKMDRSIDGEHYLNYDLYYPEGYSEALSGAIREHEYEHIRSRIEKDGLSLKTYEKFLERAKKGQIHSSAGGGFGVERLVRFLTGVEHISEVQLFERIPGRKVEV